jgi:hypothetical protein
MIDTDQTDYMMIDNGGQASQNHAVHAAPDKHLLRIFNLQFFHFPVKIVPDNAQTLRCF